MVIVTKKRSMECSVLEPGHKEGEECSWEDPVFPRKGLDLHLVGCSRHGLILEQLGSVTHSVREGLPLPLRAHDIGAWTLAEQGDAFL